MPLRPDEVIRYAKLCNRIVLNTFSIIAVFLFPVVLFAAADGAGAPTPNAETYASLLALSPILFILAMQGLRMLSDREGIAALLICVSSLLCLVTGGAADAIFNHGHMTKFLFLLPLNFFKIIGFAGYSFVKAILGGA